MTVKELSREQLIELKQNYLSTLNRECSDGRTFLYPP